MGFGHRVGVRSHRGRAPSPSQAKASKMSMYKLGVDWFRFHTGNSDDDDDTTSSSSSSGAGGDYDDDEGDVGAVMPADIVQASEPASPPPEAPAPAEAPEEVSTRGADECDIGSAS